MNKGQSGGWPTGSPSGVRGSVAAIILNVTTFWAADCWEHLFILCTKKLFLWCLYGRKFIPTSTAHKPLVSMLDPLTKQLSTGEASRLQGLSGRSFFVTLRVHSGSQTNKGKRGFVRFGRSELRIRNSICHILYFSRKFWIDNLQQWMKNR